ncbi:c-type cytochrome biogenesis protein CcsB [candidate division CSSED10-310 bacterium]|uniref:Heme exporter protein C n=1 Tax=candidate division CSSED10-310 bacterium TaxID=2855610 RepID=A0ABV6YWI6_UNCC1
MVDLIFFYFALVSYFLAFMFSLLYLHQNARLWRSVMFYLLLVGFSGQTFSILSRGITARYFPGTSLYEALSLFAWMFILFSLFIYSKDRTGIFSAQILALTLIFMAIAIPTSHEIRFLPPALDSAWLTFHVSLIIAGEAALGILFCFALLYLLLERQLKLKRVGYLYYRLPPLQMLDDLSYRVLSLGFFLLTLGIITGSAWASVAWGSYWSWDPKETWSLISWLIYAALFHVRIAYGWRGKKVAILAVLGFVFVIFNLLGITLLFSSLHTYGSGG